MRRATAIGIAASTALIIAAAGHATSPRSPTLTGCLGQRLIRPTALDFCGDGAFFLRQIRWASWGQSSAVAAATAHQDDCRPDCARGTYHVYPVAVWLSRARLCSDNRVQFTRLAYEFVAQRPPGTKPGPHLVNAPLGVGTNHCP